MAALSAALTDPVSREALLSSETVSPFTNIAVGDASYSGEAAIPEAGGAEGALPAPPRKLAVSSETYGQALPQMSGDDVGLSPVNAVSHFPAVTPPNTPTASPR